MAPSEPIARSVRSGLIEAVHRGTVVVTNSRRETIRSWGPTDTEFFMRSAAKPFQATVAQESGAELRPTQMALACASHDGEPAHVAIVDQMLTEVGLAATALLCPPSVSPQARARPEGGQQPSPLLHPCSGKHAAMLRACVANSWPLSYTDPDHPLQRRNRALLASVTGDDPVPVGIDGCGVPTFRVTVAGMGRAFARLACEERFAQAAEAMHRYPALVSGTDRSEAALGIAANAAVKGGAQGCLGVAVLGCCGFAAKSEDGSFPAVMVAVIEAMRRSGLISPTAAKVLAPHARPSVLGRGEPVGALEPALR